MDIDNNNKDNVYEFTDIHRGFLQSMLSHRVLNMETAEGLYDTLCTINAEQTSQDYRRDFQEFITHINLGINEMDLSLQRVIDEITGDVMLLLKNTRSDFSSQIATLYTSNELNYFKHLLDGIMEAIEDFSLTSDQALNIARNDQVNMSLRKAQDVLDQLVMDGWLYKNGRYTLSLRSKAELQDFIKENYPDSVVFCSTCSGLATTGLQCRQCNTRIHKHCLTTTFSFEQQQQQPSLSLSSNNSSKNMETTKITSICSNCLQPMNLFGLLLIQNEENNDK